MISNLIKIVNKKTIFGVTGAFALSALTIGQSSADPITVVSWGGSYGKAQDAALFTDASKNSGIKINRESGARTQKCELRRLFEI